MHQQTSAGARHTRTARIRLRLRIIGFAVAAAWLPATALAQVYPAKNISIVVPLAAGSGMDTIVRLYGEKLSQSLGKPVIADNRPGAATMLGAGIVAKAPADGYTLLVATSSAMAINQTLYKQIPYDPEKDFVPISLYVKSPFVLVVNPALPIRSVAELVRYAKDKIAPLSYSTPGAGTAQHLTVEFMKQKYGLDITHVPYKNSTQSIADIFAGHVSMAFGEAGISLPLIKDGKLRPLAVSSSKRLPTLPDVLPFGETVGVPEFEAVSWHVLLAPAGTPKDIVERLHQEMKRIMGAPDIQQRIASLGLIAHDSPSPEGIQQYIRSERDKWGTLVRSLGLAGSQ